MRGHQRQGAQNNTVRLQSIFQDSVQSMPPDSKQMSIRTYCAIFRRILARTRLLFWKMCCMLTCLPFWILCIMEKYSSRKITLNHFSRRLKHCRCLDWTGTAILTWRICRQEVFRKYRNLIGRLKHRSMYTRCPSTSKLFDKSTWFLLCFCSPTH